jgi:hypothetical protein
MHSVEESLLRTRHSVGSETDTALGRERACTRERLAEIKGDEAVKPNAFRRKTAPKPPISR